MSKVSSKEFTVALLIEDIEEAKKLSDGLRDLGIFAHYYQDLDDMWVSINTHTPDLSIVDVKKMSQGTLLLKQHPKVQSEELKLAFYYNENTKVLLNSTYELDHYGHVRAELNLISQLKSILKRRNKELQLENEVLNVSDRLEKLKVYAKNTNNKIDNVTRHLEQYNSVEKKISSFGTTNSVEEYTQRLVSFFTSWDECISFGIYKLSSTSQKLISPKHRTHKFKVLPDLWLSNASDDGIADYAQEMAYDVAYGIMDKDIIANRVFGTNNNPDLLIIGQYNNHKLKGFNWSLLEQKLNSEYRKSIGKELLRSNSKDTHASNLAHTLQAADDIQFLNTVSDHKFLMLNFNNLLDLIKNSYSNRFSWVSFTEDFESELSSLLNGDFKVTQYGVENYIVSIDKKYLDHDLTAIKTFCRKFQFWRYFEDSSIIVTQNLVPDMKLVAPSSINFIKHAQDGFSNILEETKSYKSSIRKHSLNEMQM